MRTVPLFSLLFALLAALLVWPTDTEARGPVTKPQGKQRGLVELGRRLFFEPVLSRTGQRSCASCHHPEHGFSDPAAFSDDDIGRTLRHSQTVIDSAFNPNAHWDGEFRTIEALVTARVGLPQGARGSGYGRSPTPLTPGHSSLPDPQDRPKTDTADGDVITSRDPDLDRKLAQLARGQNVLEQHGRYADAMRDTFGDTSITRARVARAIAAYCRSIVHTESAYDNWKAGEVTALSASAKRGMALFRGRAGCAQCHTLAPYDRRSRLPAGRRAAFTDLQFHNTGLAWRETHQDVPIVASDDETPRGFVFSDPGRGRLTGASKERRAFKTPTLRDVTRRGPFMHDASFDSLEGVIRYYAGGGSKDPEQDPRIRPFEVTDADVSDLLAFLKALESSTRPGLAETPYRARPGKTRLRFVDADGEPLAGLAVRLVPAGDRLPSETAPQGAVSLVTGAKGWLEYAPRAHTHMRIVLPGDVRPEGGVWVPDACSKATVRVPVRGHATVAVLVNKGRTLPETIHAEHVGGLRFEGHDATRTMLTRTHVLEAEDHRILRYRGWMRTDVPATVTFALPGTKTEGLLTLDAKTPLRLDLRRSTDTRTPD